MVLLSGIKFALNDTGDYTSEIMTFLNFLVSVSSS